MSTDLTGLGSVASFAKSVVDRIWPPSASAEDKIKAQVELERMTADRDNTVVQAKAAVMTAELNQDDNYTKRGRPSIIYAGLIFIFLVHVLFPITAWTILALKGSEIEMPDISLPAEFWVAWGGAVSIYIIGRSKEKAGGAMDGLLGKAYNLVGGKTTHG